jgi:MFS transporter, DHA2 family, multidrug resistance protein
LNSKIWIAAPLERLAMTGRVRARHVPANALLRNDRALHGFTPAFVSSRAAVQPSSTISGLPPPRRYWSAATIWLALTISVLDGSIANVALPTIAKDLAAAPENAVWIVNAYQLTIVISLLPMAALGQIMGFRRVFLAGLLLFTAASLGCTLATSLPMLAMARALQGFGAAGIMSQNGALVRFTYPSTMLGKALGLNALVASGAAALGPTVASAILAAAPWQWLFAVNVPLGVAAYLMGRASLPENPLAGSLDWFGSLLNVLMFGPLFIGIDMVTRGGNATLGVVLLAIGVLSGGWLTVRALHQSNPVMPVDLLRNGLFALSVATSVASFSAQMLAFVSLPFFFENTLHWSQVQTGLLMTPWPLAVGIGAPIAGRLADHFPAAILGGAGLALMTAGLILLAMLSSDATAMDIVWRMALCGLGFGFFQAPNNRAMLSAAPMNRSGAAGGMLATARLAGQTIGATLAAISFRFASHAEGVALGTAAVLAGIAALVSVARLRHRDGAKSSRPAAVADAA